MPETYPSTLCDVAGSASEVTRRRGGRDGRDRADRAGPRRRASCSTPTWRAAAGPGGGAVRPRQRQQPPQPAQPLRRRASCSDAGLATLLIDLLTPDEERGRRCGPAQLRFDIGLLADRLVGAYRLARASTPARAGLALGYFGASTGGGRGAGRRRRAPGRGRARSCPAAAGPTSPARRCARGPRTHPADRRRATTPSSSSSTGAPWRELRRRDAAGDRPRRDPPVRGARHARAGRPAGPRLVRQSRPAREHEALIGVVLARGDRGRSFVPEAIGVGGRPL